MLATQFTELVTFLKAHQRCWHPAILPLWPESRAGFPDEWLAYAAGLSFAEQRILADGKPLPGMPSDLRAMLETALRLSEVVAITQEQPLDRFDIQGLNLKKQHEISRLLPFIAANATMVTHAIDIGGGMGHLARMCVKYFDWDFHSIDRDAALQQKGQWWLHRSRDLSREKLTFVRAEFAEAEDPEVDGLFAAPKTLSLGLHTCGGLALSQFQKSLRCDVIINFGCCFDKMDLAKDVNRSRSGQDLGLSWSQAALFLATRSRQQLTVPEFTLLKRVNDYRFALDLWFRRHFPDLGFIVAGDAPKALYRGSFGEYALDRLKNLRLATETTPAALQAFYEQTTIQKEIAELFAAHLIRDAFARPLELAILLDRALWLEDQGCTVSLSQVFDRITSPRNIAIVARPSRA